MVKPGGANLLNRKYFYEILWSTLKISWGCSPIAPPFLPPLIMTFADMFERKTSAVFRYSLCALIFH